MKLTSLSLVTPYTKQANAFDITGKVAYAFLKDAAGDSLSYAERNGDDFAASYLNIRLNTEISLSLFNFAHFSEDSYEERANLWEVGILINGELLGADEGNEEQNFFQLKTGWVKELFEALDKTETFTVVGLVGLLAALSENH